MDQAKKPASLISQSITLVVVMLPVLIIAMLIGSHITFQKRIVAVMKYQSAQELGLLPKSAAQGPFDPKRVWIAKNTDGEYEFRSAWPLVGSVPFDLFGSGTTGDDLLAACDRLGNSGCKRI